MLSIGMKPGEYFTISEEIVVQYGGTDGNLGRVLISAPREVPVLRGKLWEQAGHPRPECLTDARCTHHSTIRWGRQKDAVLEELRSILRGMEDTPERREIERRLELLFPSQQAPEEPKVSTEPAGRSK